jgi:hypothetical protein
MFTAEKAKKLTKKVQEDRLGSWEHLQFLIRDRAIHGFNTLEIEDENARYLNLCTALEVFGYEIKFNREKYHWTISW